MKNIEYLIAVDSSNGQLESIENLQSLITTNSKFKFESSNSIKYGKNKYSIFIDIASVPESKWTVFHIVFSAVKITDKFREMLKTFRTLIMKYSIDDFQVIWDDISFEWSCLLYPKIFKTENLMRKLISKFMITKLGVGWHNTNTPKDVKESLKQKEAKFSSDFLFNIDFIVLVSFLFKEYTQKSIETIPDLLKTIIKDGLTDDLKNELNNYMPINNWDRYFSSLLNCESEALKKKWQFLYTIRCKVAHNTSLTFDDYSNCLKLCEELDIILIEAIDQLINIKIPEEDVEDISSQSVSAASSSALERLGGIAGIANSKDYFTNIGGVTGLAGLTKTTDYLANIGGATGLAGLTKTTDSFANIGGVTGLAGLTKTAETFANIGGVTGLAGLTKTAETFANIGGMSGLAGLTKTAETFANIGGMSGLAGLTKTTDSFANIGGVTGFAKLSTAQEQIGTIRQEADIHKDPIQIPATIDSSLKSNDKPKPDKKQKSKKSVKKRNEGTPKKRTKQ